MTTITLTTIAALLVCGMAPTPTCRAEAPAPAPVNPAEFLSLLGSDAQQPALGGTGRFSTGPTTEQTPPAEPRVQRLLEESELILQGIAADAVPSQATLEEHSREALKVIREYLRSTAAQAPRKDEARPPRHELPTPPPAQAPPVASVPGGSSDGGAASRALRDMADELRALATQAESRAAALERTPRVTREVQHGE